MPAWRVLSLLSLFFFSGCTHVFFEPAAKKLAETAADFGNEQMLLNLARETNQEPAYFVQLGPINGSMTASSVLGLPSSVSRTFNPRGSVTATGGLSTTLTENPAFTLTPLSGESFGKTYIEPLDPKFFSSLIDEGFYADVVARVMVNYVEINYAGIGADGHSEIWHNDPDPKEALWYRFSYERFLELCIELKEAQLADLITVGPDFQPSADTRQAVDSAPTFTAPKLSDAVAAMHDGLDLKAVGTGSSSYVLEDKNIKRPKYVQIRMRPDCTLPPLKYPTLHGFLASGGAIYVGDRPKDLKATSDAPVVCLHLTSFENVLAAVSSEQKYYGTYSHYERCLDVKGQKFVARPLLCFYEPNEPRGGKSKCQRVGPADYKFDSSKAIATVKHRGERYFIENISGEANVSQRTPSSENKEVFTLLVYLANLSGIDSTKLTIPQVIGIP